VDERTKENRERELRRSANKKFHHEDFSGLDLSTSDFRNATLIECNFTGTILKWSNFEGANCFGSDFTDADLYRVNFKEAILAKTKMFPRDCFGMTVTLTCDTFQGMEVPDRLLLYWLYMGTMMKVPTEEMSQKIVEAIGRPEFEKLQRAFKERKF